jgi:hypothetical protein
MCHVNSSDHISKEEHEVVSIALGKRQVIRKSSETRAALAIGTKL